MRTLWSAVDGWIEKGLLPTATVAYKYGSPSPSRAPHFVDSFLNINLSLAYAQVMAYQSEGWWDFVLNVEPIGNSNLGNNKEREFAFRQTQFSQ